MPKKRKTRKEKILLDKKKQTVHQSTLPVESSPQNEPQQQEQKSIATGMMTFSIPQTQNKTPEISRQKEHVSQIVIVDTNEYNYLSNDLMRTALLTGAIVFAELVIKLFIVRG